MLNNIKERKGKEKKNKTKHGDFVFLADAEYNDLVQSWGKTNTDELIQEMNDWIGSKGDKYKSHYHALRVWYKRRHPDERPRRQL